MYAGISHIQHSYVNKNIFTYINYYHLKILDKKKSYTKRLKRASCFFQYCDGKCKVLKLKYL